MKLSDRGNTFLEARDRRKRLNIPKGILSAGGMVRKQQVQYLLMQKNNHMTAENPRHSTACEQFHRVPTQNERFLPSPLTTAKIYSSYGFELFYRVYCLFLFLRLSWQESTIFLANRVFRARERWLAISKPRRKRFLRSWIFFRYGTGNSNFNAVISRYLFCFVFFSLHSPKRVTWKT